MLNLITKLLITILLCSSIPKVLGDKIYRHKSSAVDTLNGFLASETAKSIGVVEKCLTAQGVHEEQCMLDISGFSKENIKKLLDKAEEITPSVRCSNSSLTELDFSPLEKLGHRVETIPLKDNAPALVVVDNLQLKNISLGDVFRRGYMYPRFFTIYNNPQLSRDSIDRIKLMVAEQIKEQENKIGHDYNRVLVEKILIQNYGECDFQMWNPGKTSLSWEEFRWCKTVLHDVTLEGDEFHSELETANIIEVKGCLKIKNTKITDLTMLPNRISVKRGCSEITGNKDLCVSYDDEIRLKTIGFEIKDNKKMSCRGEPVTTKAPTTSTTNAPTTKTSTTEEPTTSISSAPSTTVSTSTTEAPTSTTEASTTTSTTEAPTTTSTTEAPTTISSTEAPTTTSTTEASTTTSSTEASTSTTNAPTTSTRNTPTARTARVSTSTASSVKIDSSTVKSGNKPAVQKKGHFEKASGNVNATETELKTTTSGTGQIDIGRVILSIFGPIFPLVLFR